MTQAQSKHCRTEDSDLTVTESGRRYSAVVIADVAKYLKANRGF